MRPDPEPRERTVVRPKLTRAGDRDVRKRIVLLFLVGVATPSALLGYLALRGVRNDQALFERDQREALERTAEEALAAFEARLSTVALTHWPDSSAFQNPLVDAVFRITPDGRFDGLVSSKALYRSPTQQPPANELSNGDETRLRIARQRELRDGDLAAAAAEYDSILSEANSERGRAEALNGLARVLRKQAKIDAAIGGYRRLISEYGHVPTGAGIPYALAGRLELQSALEGRPDVNAAATEAAALLETLLAAEHELSETEYRFVADRARDFAEELARGFDEGSVPARSPDSLRALLAREETERARSERIQGFVALARDAPESFRRIVGTDRTPRPGRAMLQDEDGPYPVYLPEVWGSDAERWETVHGLLLDPVVLEQTAREVVSKVVGPRGFRWVLRDTAGTTRVASPDDEGEPVVLTGFPGQFPPLVLGLLPPPTGPIESFFASPRSLYLYAFVLVAATLAGGLALTLRTLSHQLELSRMQSDFVSTVSHELKSPVTSIRQLAGMLQAERVPSEARRRRYFDVMVEQSERLTALIEHVLDFARMDAGHTELDLVEVDLRSFLEDLVSGIQESVRHRGFLLRAEIDADLPRVTLDREEMALAATNLIDNAVKYSGDSREVVVHARTENGQVVIDVQDFGIGLDPSERDRVFERFYRGGEALTRSVKGTGLGLTLARKIVEAHGGTIDARGEPGKGSTFTIRLPVSGP